MPRVKLEIDTEQSRIDALKVYLSKKNTSLEQEISRHIDSLYVKTVPAIVREYLKAVSEKDKNEGRNEAANNA